MANTRLMSELFLSSPKVDEATKSTLLSMDEESLQIAFSGFMTFGTAGLRAKMQPGTAFMNTYTVALAAASLAKVICAYGTSAMNRGVVIAHDSRKNAKEFALRSAQVLSAYGIKVYLFDDLRPTPVLSFALRHLSCIAGINILKNIMALKYIGKTVRRSVRNKQKLFLHKCSRQTY